MKWLRSFGKKAAQTTLTADPVGAGSGDASRVATGQADLSADPTMLAIGATLADTYHVQKRLGAGGMGTAYLAHHMRWGRPVVLKVPTAALLADAQHRHRITTEAEAWTDLGLHLHIAYCHYIHPIAQTLVLVIEYVNGGNLRDWISAHGGVDLRAGLDLAIQLCHGLEHAHASGLVHRDVKPENILLTDEGLLKVTDFGIARRQESGAPAGPVSTGGPSVPGVTVGAIGTYEYMAPEQFADPRSVDARADVFAIGVCLYEMFSGRRPFNIAVGPAQAAPDPTGFISSGGVTLPKPLVEAMTRSVAWDRNRRPSSVAELRQHMCDAYRQEFGESSPFETLISSPPKADGLNNRAIAYYGLNQVDNAMRLWRDALQLDPDHFPALFNLGYVRYKRAELSALDYWKQLKQLSDAAAHVEFPTWNQQHESLHAKRARALRQQYVLRYEACLRWLWFQEFGLDMLGMPKEWNEPILVGAPPRAMPDINPDFALKDLGPMPRFRREKVQELTQPAFPLLSELPERGHMQPASERELVAVARRGIEEGRFAETYEQLRTAGTAAGGDNDLETAKLINECATKGGGMRKRPVSQWLVRNCGRHRDRVSSLAFMEDQQHVLSGGWDHSVRLAEIGHGRDAWCATGHQGKVSVVGFSGPDAGAFSASHDGSIRWWNVQTGCETTRCVVGQPIVAMLKKDALAICACQDKQIHLWHVGERRELSRLCGHTDSVLCLALSQDGRLLASGGLDRTIRIWDLAGGRELSVLRGHEAGVEGMHFSTDGRELISASRDGTLRIWDLSRKSESRRLLNLKVALRSVEPMIAGSGFGWLLTRSDDRLARVWSPQEQQVSQFDANGSSVTAASFSSEAFYGVLGTSDGSVGLWAFDWEWEL